MGTTMKEIDRRLRLYADLAKLGIAHEDCVALRRISMTLHRWHELECGCEAGAIEREGENGDGRPFWHSATLYGAAGRPRRYVADRERGAQRRLAKIMARYPGFTAYVQGDPRGCALYILRSIDVPEGKDVGSCYNRGIAVY